MYREVPKNWKEQNQGTFTGRKEEKEEKRNQSASFQLLKYTRKINNCFRGKQAINYKQQGIVENKSHETTPAFFMTITGIVGGEKLQMSFMLIYTEQ